MMIISKASQGDAVGDNTEGENTQRHAREQREDRYTGRLRTTMSTKEVEIFTHNVKFDLLTLAAEVIALKFMKKRAAKIMEEPASKVKADVIPSTSTIKFKLTKDFSLTYRKDGNVFLNAKWNAGNFVDNETLVRNLDIWHRDKCNVMMTLKSGWTWQSGKPLSITEHIPVKNPSCGFDNTNASLTPRA